MTKSLRLRYWQLSFLVALAVAGAVTTVRARVLAQISPDNTLGSESSKVTSTHPGAFQIDGGATRGTNLFHSFSEFSIPTKGEASFNNGLNIQNVISRVTGESVSNIDGSLRANGTANLFLINPNGIIFGPNASLNIGGSFVASTASSINLADGTSFSATAPTTTSLLTVSVPLGLQYGVSPGRIEVQGDGQGRRTTTELIDTTVGLRVQPNQTLALVGGDVALLGGTLKTSGGRVELGSVAGPGLVNLTPIDSGWALGYEGVPSFGDIQLSGAATVDASGAGGGDIQVQGRRVTLTNGSQIEASTLGAEPGGTLSVSASDNVELIGISADSQFFSGLLARTRGAGNGGDLTIATGRLTVQGGARVSASTTGTGAGGTLSVRVSGVIELIGESADGRFGSGLYAQTQGAGNGGDLTIATGRLIVQGGAQVSTNTFGAEAAGTLSVTASDVIELIGESADGQFSSALLAQTEGDGNAGDLTIATGRLIVRDGGQVSTGTFGAGDGGTLSVSASNVVELIGTSADGQFSSGLFADTQGDGNPGDLTITTRQLIVRDGAQLSASTFGTGAGATLSVSASDVVELIGTSADGQISSGLSTQTSGDGNAGDLTIATERLTVRDGAEVAVSSKGAGNAGSLRVAAGSVLLENQGKLLASTASGEGGNIDLQVQNLILMRQNSLISAEAEGTGNGGNITIHDPFIVAVPDENSDIFANAIQGRGGNINITTQGIYGLEYRSNQTTESDINASSQFGVSGTVQINNPDVDLTRGLVELPAALVDTSNQIATACAAGGENEFIITGRAGLPPNPYQPLDASEVWRDVQLPRELAENLDGVSQTSTPTITPRRIVEAQEWIVNENGNVEFVAKVPSARSQKRCELGSSTKILEELE